LWIGAYRGLRRQKQHALLSAATMWGVPTIALASRLVTRFYCFGPAQAEAHEDSSTNC
jgi:hypothetical protein